MDMPITFDTAITQYTTTTRRLQSVSLQMATGKSEMGGIQLDPANFSMASKFDAQVHLMEGAPSNAVKEVMSQVSTDHAKLGAAQASLEAESERLTAARSSLTSAGSRITDVSYALAVTKKSAAHVQLQMATAILAHKSINPEAALYLTL